jgi:hypothetical protein
LSSSTLRLSPESPDRVASAIASGEQPPPRRPDRRAVLGDEPNVPASWPADDVTGEGGNGEDLCGCPHGRPRSPVRCLCQHPHEDRRVVGGCATNDEHRDDSGRCHKAEGIRAAGCTEP